MFFAKVTLLFLLILNQSPAQLFARGLPSKTVLISDQLVQVRGTWAFRENDFIDKDELPTLEELEFRDIKVPGNWNHFDPNNITGRRAGAYVIKITGRFDKNLGVFQERVMSSYRLLWAFQKNDTWTTREYSVGRPSLNLKETIPFHQKKLFELPIDPTVTTYYLIYNVSNYHNPRGGIAFEPKIGEYDTALRSYLFERLFVGSEVGILLILAIYNLSIVMNRKGDSASLFLALLCLTIATRVFLVNHLLEFFVNTPSVFLYELRFKIEYLSTALIPFVVILMIGATVDIPVKIFTKIAGGMFLFDLIFFTMSSMIVYAHSMIPVQIPYLPMIIVISLVFYRAFRGETTSRMLATGASFSIVGSLFDIAVARELISAPFLGSYSMIVFLLFQSHITGKKYGEDHRKARHLSDKLGLEVKEQTRRIRSMLDNIPQGIFTISSSDLQIDKDYSAELVAILGKEFVQQGNLKTFFEDHVININGDNLSRMVSVIGASINEHEIGFFANGAALPTEVQIQLGDQIKVIKIDWSCILLEDHTVERILVSVTDVSNLKKLEVIAKDKERESQIISELVNVSESRLNTYIESTQRYLQECNQVLTNLDSFTSSAAKNVFFNLHTIKGTSRILSLSDITDAIHEAEELFKNLNEEISNQDKELMQVALNQITNVFNEYRDINYNKIGRCGTNEVIVMKDHFSNLLNKLFAIPLESENYHRIKLEYSKICYKTLNIVVKESAQGLESIAQTLNKDVPIIRIEGEEVILSYLGEQVLSDCLTHLFRNSIDHGIESLEQRIEKSKPKQGTIIIETSRKGDFLNVKYGDDGQGLNLERLREQGIKKGLIREDNSYEAPQIAELIFAELSTAKKLSNISGRGVGMGAIRKLIEENDASLDIELGEQRGPFVSFTIILSLPNTFYLDVSASRTSA